MIYKAMQHDGFAFIQVLSQCVTFCPEQVHWKDIVHDEQVITSDAVQAANFLHGDDGFAKGIFYCNPRRSWPITHSTIAGTSIRQGLSV